MRRIGTRPGFLHFSVALLVLGAAIEPASAPSPTAAPAQTGAPAAQPAEDPKPAATIAPAKPTAAPAVKSAQAKPAASPAAKTAAKAPVKIGFMMPWILPTEYSYFLVADAKGYYKDEGIQIRLNEGSGSGNTVKLVGAGTLPIGLAVGSRVLESPVGGIPFKVVMTPFYTSHQMDILIVHHT